MKKEYLADFEFKQTGLNEFELYIENKIPKILGDKVYNKVVNLLIKRKQLKEKPEKPPENFVVPTFFLNLLAIQYKSTIKDIKKQIEKDGINIIRWKLKETVMSPKKKGWELLSKIEGEMSKK